MIIGQHFLEGEVINLKSAMIILDEDQTSPEMPYVDRQLDIKGIIKKKIIFKTRPKPVGAKRPRLEKSV